MSRFFHVCALWIDLYRPSLLQAPMARTKGALTAAFKNRPPPKSAKVMIMTEDGYVLFLQRENNRAYDLVGGKPLARDKRDLKKTTRRETKEETGYTIDPQHLIPLGHAKIAGKDRYLFLYSVPERFEPVLREGEHTGYQWFSVKRLQKQEFPKNIHSTTRELIDKINFAEILQAHGFEQILSTQKETPYP